MAWDNVLHKRLRDISAYLWEDARDCKRLVADALIDATRINWDEPPTLRWQSVIMECEKQGTLDKLCPVMLKEYPENTSLREAVAPWMDNDASAGKKSRPKPKPVVKQPLQVPAEYIDSAEDMLVTMEAIRADLGWLARQVDELVRWRRQTAMLAAKDRAGQEEDESTNVSVSLPSKKED